MGNDPVLFSKDPGTHITVTQEGLARAGDKCWRQCSYFSDTFVVLVVQRPLALHSNITANISLILQPIV